MYNHLLMKPLKRDGSISYEMGINRSREGMLRAFLLEEVQ
jgi:hypothetical protein